MDKTGRFRRSGTKLGAWRFSGNIFVSIIRLTYRGVPVLLVALGACQEGVLVARPRVVSAVPWRPRGVRHVLMLLVLALLVADGGWTGSGVGGC